MAIIWVGTGRFGVALDPDASAYITAVETADGQVLETDVRDAINAFVIGCKADGIWNAIKASCIMAGARTLNGALRPLVGAAPTNVGFVSGDYNRKTGLIGDASSKCLNSNRNNTADPQNSKHMAVYVTQLNTADPNGVIMANAFAFSGWSFIISRTATGTPANRYEFGVNQSTYPSGVARSTGFVGVSRASSSTYTGRAGGSDVALTAGTQTPSSSNVFVFNSNSTSFADAYNGRLSFYSIGESLNLALLDARVTTLMNALAAAIP
jgi:hypothetical protein